MQQLTVGVIGLAAGMNLQCYFLHRMPERYRMKWLCDLDEAKTSKGTEEYGGQGTTDLNDILNDDEVDLITIATPVRTHVELAKQALKAGKHVLVEKPIAVSVAEADELIQCARGAGKILCVDHERRFYANQKAVDAVVKGGEIGKVLSVRMELPLASVKGLEKPADPKTWIDRFVVTPGYDYLVHHVDQVCLLLGEKPQKVFGRYQTLTENDLPCEMEIAMIMPSGIMATIGLHYSFAPEMKWLVNGEKGSLRMQFANDMGPCFVYQSLPDGAKRVREILPSCTSQESFIEFYRRLYEAIVEGKSVPATAEDARDAVKVIWLALESARSGKIVNC